MRGRDISTARMRLDASVEELATEAGIEAVVIEEWERFPDLKLARRETDILKLAIWGLERNRIMTAAGVEPCPWWRNREPPADTSDPGAVQRWQAEGERHLAACDACARVEAFVQANVPPPPFTSARAAGLLQRLPAPARSAAFGALVILFMMGMPILGLLGLGVLRSDLSLIAAGLLALVGAMAAGAVAGWVHYHAAPLERLGTAGYYGRWILAMYGYIAALVGLAALALRFPALAGNPDIADLAAMASDPVSIGVFAVLGVVFGIALGRGARAPAEEADEKERGPWTRHRRLGWVGGTAVLVLVVGGLTAFGVWAGGPAAGTAAGPDPQFRAAVERGRELLLAHDDEGALVEARRALDRAPGHPAALEILAWAALETRDIETAARAADEALARQPDLSVPHYVRAKVLLYQGDEDSALVSLRRAVALDSSRAVFFADLARLAHMQGHYDEAAGVVAEIAARWPGYHQWIPPQDRSLWEDMAAGRPHDPLARR